MAEILISSYHSRRFPVAIVRPSLVGCTARAPHPGYFGNNAGPTAVGLAFAVGIATYTSHHVSHCHLRPETCFLLLLASIALCVISESSPRSYYLQTSIDMTAVVSEQ